VLAISNDPIEDHCAFAEKLGGLDFPHLADTEMKAINAFGVINDRGNGCKRSVFIVDSEGKIQLANRAYNVNEASHYQEIFDTLARIK
jgi:peroxiredoxin